MQIDIKELIELVKSVKPMFLNHTEAEHVTVKGRADFVTQVDIRVQEYMRNELSKRWPNVQFMGEEKDNSDIDFNGAVWILDPVDGTTNLIHDFKDSALSLGLCEQGQVTLGVIYHPFLDEIFWAQKGKGAFCNGKPIHVSDTRKLEDSLVAVGTSHITVISPRKILMQSAVFMSTVWIFAVWEQHPLIWHMLPVDASRHTLSEI